MKEELARENLGRPSLSPAKAYWNQRSVLRCLKERVLALSEAVGYPSDLSPVQWAQLMAFALEFKPDLILELGRGRGNSTCAFTETANFLETNEHGCRVVSLCLSGDWEEITRPRLLRIVPDMWFRPLQALAEDILTFDYRAILADVDRCLIFWDAHGYDVAECVLGRILPELVGRDHYVIMHDLSDARYIATDKARYGKHGLWKGNNWSGPRLRLGCIDTAVEQAVAIVDFTSRNNIPLHSADHSLHTEIESDGKKLAEMTKAVGKDLFSLSAHWFWFTLNDAEGPLTFPRFESERYEISRRNESPDDLALFRDALESTLPSRPGLAGAIRRINRYLREDRVGLALKILQKELGDLPGSSVIRSKLGLLRDAIRLDQLPETALEKEVVGYSREELRTIYGNDPWLSNYVVNIWEYATGQSVLSTYPWNVCLPIADICNARCPFCNAWLRGRRWLRLDELERFSSLLQVARLFGLAGHGEPLLHPAFNSLALRLREILDPRCLIYLITNGLLLGRHVEVLRQMNVRTYTISLNAASSETHQKIMRLGEDGFDKILYNIGQLLAMRDSDSAEIQIILSFVVINQNIHELASFIELGNRLQVDQIQIRTLSPVPRLPPGLNYHTLPPYQNRHFSKYRDEAVRAIRDSDVQVIGSPETWEAPVFPVHLMDEIEKTLIPVRSVEEVIKDPEIRSYYDTQASRQMTMGKRLETVSPLLDKPDDTLNFYNRTPRHKCRAVYHTLNLNDFYFRMYPCCYMVDIPGFEAVHYDGTFDLFKSWNSPAMVEVRRRLVEGPLLDSCKRCPQM